MSKLLEKKSTLKNFASRLDWAKIRKSSKIALDIAPRLRPVVACPAVTAQQHIVPESRWRPAAAHAAVATKSSEPAKNFQRRKLNQKQKKYLKIKAKIFKNGWVASQQALIFRL